MQAGDDLHLVSDYALWKSKGQENTHTHTHTQQHTQRNILMPQSNSLFVIVWNNSRNAAAADCWLSSGQSRDLRASQVA